MKFFLMAKVYGLLIWCFPDQDTLGSSICYELASVQISGVASERRGLGHAQPEYWASGSSRTRSNFELGLGFRYLHCLVVGWTIYMLSLVQIYALLYSKFEVICPQIFILYFGWTLIVCAWMGIWTAFPQCFMGRQHICCYAWKGACMTGTILQVGSIVHNISWNTLMAWIAQVQHTIQRIQLSSNWVHGNKHADLHKVLGYPHRLRQFWLSSQWQTHRKAWAFCNNVVMKVQFHF